MGKGLVHIYTGDGKGKTTAATGLAIRAPGHGLKVVFASFFKLPDMNGANEIGILKKNYYCIFELFSYSINEIEIH